MQRGTWDGGGARCPTRSARVGGREIVEGTHREMPVCVCVYGCMRKQWPHKPAAVNTADNLFAVAGCGSMCMWATISLSHSVGRSGRVGWLIGPSASVSRLRTVINKSRTPFLRYAIAPVGVLVG